MLLYPELLKLSPREFFNFVQGCTYISDPKGIEFVTRPKILLQILFSGNSFYFDCDDRSGLSRICELWKKPEAIYSAVLMRGSFSLPSIG